MTQAARPAARRRRGTLLRRAAALALMGAAIVFLWRLASEIGWSTLGRTIAGADPGLLALAGAINLARYAIWAARLRALMAPVARPPLLPAMRAVMASLFFNTIVPAARPLGGLVRAVWIGRSLGLPAGPLYGAALVDQFGYGIVTLCLSAASIAIAFGSLGGKPGLGVLGGIVAAVVMGAMLSRLKSGRLLRRLTSRLPVAGAAVEGAVGGAAAVLERRASFGIIAAGGTAVWLANVLTLFVAGRAVGAEFGLAAAAAAWSSGSVAGVASGSPGGAGITESVALLPLLALGARPAEALAAVVLSRALDYGSGILIGGPCAAGGLRWFLARARDGAAENAAPPPGEAT